MLLTCSCSLLVIFAIISLSSSKPRKSCGIFIHGCNIEAEEWEKIVFGDISNGKSGRMLKAVQVVDMLLNSYITQGNLFIQSIMFGSGIDTAPNMKEGEYSRKFLLDNFNTLRSFPHFDASSMTEKQFTRLRNIIQKISCTDNHSINTATEVESCMEHFKNKNIDVIFLVSSSTHASRCLREVCNYLDQIDKTEYDPLVCMVPADTSYYGFDASDVIIFEPPHLLRDVKGYAKGRGTSSYALARRWRQLVSTNTGSRLMEQLHAEFDALLKKYE